MVEREGARRTTVEMPPRGSRARRLATRLLPWLVLVAAVSALVLTALAPSRTVMVLDVAAMVTAIVMALTTASGATREG